MGEMTPQDAAEKFADYVRGTAQTSDIATILEERLDLPGELADNSAFLARVDELVFECTGCGWWCDMSECNGDDEWTCDDCTD